MLNVVTHCASIGRRQYLGAGKPKIAYETGCSIDEPYAVMVIMMPKLKRIFVKCACFCSNL